jgi:hypothetical protein
MKHMLIVHIDTSYYRHHNIPLYNGHDKPVWYGTDTSKARLEKAFGRFQMANMPNVDYYYGFIFTWRKV